MARQFFCAIILPPGGAYSIHFRAAEQQLLLPWLLGETGSVLTCVASGSWFAETRLLGLTVQQRIEGQPTAIMSGHDLAATECSIRNAYCVAHHACV